MGAGQRGALRIEDAVKFYETRETRVLAVDHCSFDIAAGEICMVVGPSGCGKTTLLNAIAGFHSLDGGRITLDGQVLCGPGQPIAPVGSDRVVVFQNGALFPWKTVLENVAFGPTVQKKLSPAAAREKLKLLYVSCGNKDGLINISQRVHTCLKEQNVPHIWNVDDHGHDAGTWGSNLYHFAQRIFITRIQE